MIDPTVYVLLPVHNRRRITTAFVRLLAAQTYRNIQLVLIDDGSTDGTGQAVRELIPDVTILQGDGSLWWGGGLQKGFDYLKSLSARDADIILTCNDDVEIDQRFVETGVRLLAERPNSLLLAQHGSGGDTAPSESGVHFDAQRGTFAIAKTPADINCLSTRGLFMAWSTVRAVGRFHVHLLPHYGSDYEWTIRAHRKGFDLWTQPDLSLAPMREESGIRAAADKVHSFRFALHFLFSRRSLGNLFMRTTLYAMTANRRALPGILYRLWTRRLSLLVKSAVYSLVASMNLHRKS